MRIAKFIPSQRALAAVLLAVLASALIWSVHAIAERLAIGSLLDATGHRLSIYVASLESEMRRYEYLPQVVGHDARVLALLERPDDAPLQRSVNEYLESIDALAGASAIYVIDEKGLTLAASNWRLPTSFVGAVYDYRPYFQDARKGLAGRFYGVGTVSNEPGYYFANAILSAQAVVGVAAVKVNLDQLDDSWGGSGEKIAVADGNGVVFLSSEPQWKFKTLYALSSETRRRLAATRQYWQEGSLKPLGLIEKRALGSRSAIVEVADARGSALPLPATQYLVDSRGISGTDWQLLVLADMAPVRSVARSSVAVAALTLILAASGAALPPPTPSQHRAGGCGTRCTATRERRTRAQGRRPHRSAESVQPAAQQRSRRSKARRRSAQGHARRSGSYRSHGGARQDVGQHHPRAEPAARGDPDAVAKRPGACSSEVAATMPKAICR